MMSTLLFLAGYLLYFVCLAALSFLVAYALAAACPPSDDLSIFILLSVGHIIALALKNFLWVPLISESHYTLPSSLSELLAILLCLACYLVCTMVGLVVMCTCNFICEVLGMPGYGDSSGWISIIILGLPLVVMDMLLSYSDMMATVLSFACYIVFMVALSCLVLAIAHGAIDNTQIWWPELIHTSIVALTLLLLNKIWGSPFEKPVSTDDPYTKSALVGYLIYIVSSMAVSCNLFGLLLLLRTFVISLTFVLLDMLVKPSSVSDTVDALLGLSMMIATTLMALFCAVALSFVVLMFLYMCVQILLPSAWHEYPLQTFASIFGLTFVGMKSMLDIPAGPSIFSDMRVGLLGITDMINDYRSVYMVIKLFTVVAVPLLSMRMRGTISVCNLYTITAFMVALGLVLTMPITENSASTLITDDVVQQTVTSLVNSQIERMGGGIPLINDS